MPAPKKPRKSKSAQPKNQYTAELSSSQLVLGITILMVFGLACFLLGVLIGKFDPSLVPDQQIARSETPVAETSSPAAKEAAPDEPKSSSESDQKTQQPPAPVIEEKRIVVPAKPPTRPVTPATQIPESASVSSTDLPSADSPKVSIPKNTPQKAIVTPDAPRINKPVKQASATPPTPPVLTGWAVQIAALKSDSGAVVERKRLEAKLPYKIDILKRKGDVYNRLLIGQYTSKSEADVFKQELIDQYNLVGPYSVPRN